MGKNIKRKNNPVKTPQKRILIKTHYKILAVVLLIVFLGIIIFSGLVEKKTEKEYMFKKEGELSITDSSGNSKIRINIEIADTDFDRQLGLMFRRTMEENQGMLFNFPAEEMQSFWMRNTFIPLDLIFINSAKQIVTIIKNTEPLTDSNHSSTKPAKYVLEVNAGFTEKYSISEGDRVNF